MKIGVLHIVSAGLILVGITLAGFSHAALKGKGHLKHSRNPMAMQQSAYGKLLARLSESTVDRVWHLGVEQVSPHGHDDHSHEESDHDHSSHDHSSHDHSSHDHSSHDHSSHDHSSHDHSSHDHSSHDHDSHDHDSHDHHSDTEGEEEVFVFHVSDEALENIEEHDPETCDSPYCNHDHGPKKETAKTFFDQAKRIFLTFNQAKYTRTNPMGMSEAHLAWAKKSVEELLLRSYKMDPLHYGAYNSYHLFLTTHEYGGTEASREKAKTIAAITVSEAMKEKEDPEPFLTAASALLNLFFMDTGNHSIAGTKMPVEDLKRYKNDIQFCLGRFKELQTVSEEQGIWENLSTERQLEIAERARFALKTFEQFDVMIARAESPQQMTADEEVANILNFEEN